MAIKGQTWELKAKQGKADVYINRHIEERRTSKLRAQETSGPNLGIWHTQGRTSSQKSMRRSPVYPLSLLIPCYRSLVVVFRFYNVVKSCHCAICHCSFSVLCSICSSSSEEVACLNFMQRFTLRLQRR